MRKRTRELTLENLTTPRTSQELNIDFMIKYVEVKHPEKLLDFLTIAQKSQKDAKEYFKSECSEIVKKPQPSQAYADKVARALAKLQDAQASENITPIRAVV